MGKPWWIWASAAAVLAAVTGWRHSVYRFAGVVDEYESEAARYDAKWQHYTNVSIGEALVRALPTLQALPCQPTCEALDVGCGTGAFAAALRSHFPQWRVICSDVSAEMLKEAQRARHLQTVVASSESQPFADSAFDVVVTASSFHFWTNHTAAVLEMTRVLRPLGLFVLSDWSHDFLSCKFCSAYLFVGGHPPSAYNIWSLRQAQSLLVKCGLRETAAFNYLVPLKPFGFRLLPSWGMMTLLFSRPPTSSASSDL